MKTRDELVTGLKMLEIYFRQRIEGASKDSQARYAEYAEICRDAAQSVYSDGDTIKEYEEYVDRMEDDGK